MAKPSLRQQVIDALRQHPDLTSGEIATVLGVDTRSGITAVLSQLAARGVLMRIKRPNENDRTAFAYSLASTKPAAQTAARDRIVIRPAPVPVPVEVPVAIQPAGVDAIIARIPQMTIAEANRLRHALNEVFA